ncbi:MAG TPA: cation-translocating P-type ATPase [Thermoprotei archaeon]|nr:cation-translocating P-type ATPase [Thermoprotei archaeon]
MRYLARLHRRIYGIQCSFCVETIYKALNQMDGVKKVHVSMAHEELYVEFEDGKVEESEIIDVIEGLGYRLEEEELDREYREEGRRLILSGVFSLYIGVSMLLMWLGISIPFNPYIIPVLASVNLFILGYRYLAMSLYAVRRGILNQHVLMAITGLAGVLGGIAGYIYGLDMFPPMEFFGVASFVTTYHILGGYVGGYVRKRSREAIEKVKRLSPDKATVLRDGEYIEVPIEEVREGDTVLIKPGERVSIDGIIIEGYSSFDESLVSGEPLPIDKSPGDEVISGSLNIENPVLVRAVRVGGERFIDRVIEYIRLSRAAKPNILRLLDRILKFYVPMVVLTGVTSFIIWILAIYILSGVFNPSIGLYIMLTVYVMGYPCALGMASPLALVLGSSIAASKGILIRDGDSIEALPNINYILFDKTGTLTEGRPRVVAYEDLSGDPEIINAVACIESYSNHPYSKAILDYILDRYGDIECGDTRDIEYFKGEGIKGVYNGRLILIGNSKLLKRYDIPPPSDYIDDKPYSTIYVVCDGYITGIFYIEDSIRSDAKNLVNWLHKSGYKVGVVSGDDPKVVEYVCRELGIEEFRGGLLPWEKSIYISDLQRNGYKVLMVGDGINDGPSLSKADVGVALGSGSDIAIDSADIVVVSDRLENIKYLLTIGRKIYGKIRSNLILAFLFNGIGIPSAALGFIRPIHAMLAMVLSVSTVISNSLIFRDRA